MRSFEALLAAGEIQTEVPLGPFTTYRRGGPAKWYVAVERLADARVVVPEKIPVLVVGRGSNLVVSSHGFPGLVIHLQPIAGAVTVDGHRLVADGGCPLPQLARTASRASIGGLSFFVGVPGSVGGAVRMNAGCHGSETADVLVHADVWHLREGTETQRTPADLDLSYRHSNLTDEELVLGATFEGTASDHAAEESRMREISRWRREHQPGGTFNAGSVFKNPEGDAAGRIIDSLGLKGTSVGGARVSPRHANFIEADADAAPEDVYELMRTVRATVLEREGVNLVPEIRFVGFEE